MTQYKTQSEKFIEFVDFKNIVERCVENHIPTIYPDEKKAIIEALQYEMILQARNYDFNVNRQIEQL